MRKGPFGDAKLAKNRLWNKVCGEKKAGKWFVGVSRNGTKGNGLKKIKGMNLKIIIRKGLKKKKCPPLLSGGHSISIGISLLR